MVARLWEHVPAMLEWCDRFLHSDPVPGKGDIDFKRSAGDRLGKGPEPTAFTLAFISLSKCTISSV